MSPSDEQDTHEYPAPALAEDVLRPAALSSQVQVDLAAQSHPGNVRPNNEDHYLMVRGERALETLGTNLPTGHVPERFTEVVYGLLVADGMGGRAAGEIASRMAITTLVNLVLNTPDWIMRLGDHEAQEVMRRMVSRYRRADAVLREMAQGDPSLAGMGTTMTLAVSFARDLIVTHVGDSRAYLFRAGELHQMTRDQTLAQTLVDRGIILPEDAATHGLRHVLTSALGGGDGRTEPQVQRSTLTDDDQVLLCSDGLTDLVDNMAIRTILQTAPSSADACCALIDLALKNGGRDDVTVVLARYRFLQAA